MAISYAPAGSGPSAGGIGWINFGAVTFAPGGPTVPVTGTFNDGTVFSFNINVTNDSGASASFQALQPPTWSGTFFANPAQPGGYNGVIGNIALTSNVSGIGKNTAHLTNISLIDPLGNPITNYTAVVADAESTDFSEVMTWVTNGSGWSQFALLGNTVAPTITGLNTGTVSITGAQVGVIHENYVLTTNSPTTLDLSTQSTVSNARLGFAVAFVVTKVEIQKNVQGRLDPADQFTLNITGNYPATATTTGSAIGIQTETAFSYGLPTVPYTVSEAMAPGSVNPLSAYTQTVIATNLSPGQTVPPVGTLPQTVTPVLGDVIIYTVTNAILAPTAVKSVDKAFADLGDVLTYSVAVTNPNSGTLSGVGLTDAIPAGTTFVPGSLTVTNATVVGTDPSAGITLNSIPANATATVSWQVNVGNTLPTPNPILNTATITDPTGESIVTNQVSTQVNFADVATTKAVDAVFAELGQTITYTLTFTNSGNVAANNVIITDAVPNGTTFVAGSVTGAAGTPPTLTLAAPIAPNGTATVTFQVVVGDIFPVPNPIVNTASATFTYTVDPAAPDSATGNTQSNSVATQVNDANITIVKTVDKTVSDVGGVLTYTLVLTNSGNTAANNVVITDPAPLGTTFINGSLLGATGTPPTLNVASIAAGGSATVSYQVLIGDTIPTPNPIPNTANVSFTFTLDPANPDGQTGTGTSNTVNTQVNSAVITTVKTADKAYANVGDTITYTITVTNSGNVSANNVVLTDALPAGTSFVAGSLSGATGTPPTLNLNAPVPAGGSVVVSYQVKVGANVPIPNPVENSAGAAFTYTVNSAQPNGASGVSYSNTVPTQVNTAKLVMKKSVDKFVAYLNDIITYQISLTNTGNVPADNVIIIDSIPVGTILVAGSMTVSVPYTALPGGAIQLTNPVLPGETVAISFKVLVTAIPNPNPIVNMADAAYSYVVIPGTEGVLATAQTNAAITTVFRNNFSQQISDLIESVALEQAALAAIANAEGAKIQAAAAMGNITQQELLCINKSVSDMTDSITMLEAVLKQKLSVVNCQIDGTTC